MSIKILAYQDNYWISRTSSFYSISIQFWQLSPRFYFINFRARTQFKTKCLYKLLIVINFRLFKLPKKIAKEIPKDFQIWPKKLLKKLFLIRKNNFSWRKYTYMNFGPRAINLSDCLLGRKKLSKLYLLYFI